RELEEGLIRNPPVVADERGYQRTLEERGEGVPPREGPPRPLGEDVGAIVERMLHEQTCQLLRILRVLVPYRERVQSRVLQCGDSIRLEPPVPGADEHDVRVHRQLEVLPRFNIPAEVILDGARKDSLTGPRRTCQPYDLEHCPFLVGGVLQHQTECATGPRAHAPPGRRGHT